MRAVAQRTAAASMSEWRPRHFLYCPYCATRLMMSWVAGRTRPRCPDCDYVQFRNPVVGVAAVVRNDEGRVLLCRKTRTQQWTFPSGFVEWDEEVEEAVVREVFEETGLDVDVGAVLSVQSNFHNPERHTVGVWFVASINSGELTLQTEEIDQAEYFEVEHPPPLAFPTDRNVLLLLRG